MKNSPASPLLRFLQAAACTVILLWGVSAASPVLGPLLLSLVLAYTAAPFPNWLIRRFKFPKVAVIAITAVAGVALGLYLVFSFDLASVRIEQKLPIYEEHLASLYEQVTVFASAHGMATSNLSVKSVFTLSRFREIVSVFLRGVGAMISHGLLISLLGFLFIIELTEDPGGNASHLAELLNYYGSDARSYVAVTAKTAGINALINLVFLFVMGVDTPFVWAFLYFFLDFIPTLGYIIALVPPTFVTLLVYGWKRALLVACGLVVSNLIVDNVVTPIFMKKAVDISFLEITLSLLGWTFLLGLTGAILAIPLTLALKRFVAGNLREEQLAIEPSG